MTRYNEPNSIPKEFKAIKKRLDSIERSQIGPQLLTEKSEMRTPAPPANFQVASVARISEGGETTGVVIASWSPIDEATFGTPLEISHYELWGRPAEDGGVWRRLTASPATTGEYGPLPTGEVWSFRVRAIARSSTSPGEYSAEVSVTIAGDTSPPPTPSAPILTTRLGVISVQWDGTPSMPSDFSRIEVAMSSSPGAETVVGTIPGKGAISITDQPYNEERYFRLRAVDRSGNRSDWSEERSISTKPLVDVDLIDTTIVQEIEDAKDAISGLSDNLTGVEQKATDAQQAAADAQEDADKALQDALDAFNLANAKTKTTIGTSQPANPSVGDFFIHSGTKETFVWDGDSWEPTSTPLDVDELVSQLSDNQEFMDLLAAELDGVITTYYGPEPTDPNEGDLWLDTSDPDNSRLKRYDGSTWQLFDNPLLQATYEQVQGKYSLHYGDEAPADTNSLWIKNGVPHLYVDHGEDAADWLNHDTGLANWRLVAASGGSAEYSDGIIVLKGYGSRAESPIIPIEGTDPIRVSVLAKAFGRAPGREEEQDARVLFGYHWYDENGEPTTTTPTQSASALYVPEGKWDRQTRNLNYNDHVRGFRLRVSLSDQWTGEEVHIAASDIWQGPLRPTFDGDSPGFKWDGERWASTSSYAGPGWYPVSDPEVRDAVSRANGARQVADEKVRTYAQSAEPTGLTAVDIGDLWIDTDNHHIYRWNGSSWEEVVDPEASADSRIQAALEQGGLLQDLVDQIDSQIDTYYGATEPSNANEGDLWLDQSDPNNARLKRYNGSSWDIFDNPLVQSAYEVAQDALAEADKKIQTFAQDDPPSGLTSEDLGDLWIRTSDNTLHRWSGSSWVPVLDPGQSAYEQIQTALQQGGLLEELKKQADRAINTFYGPNTPPASESQEGDLWLDTTNPDDTRLKRYDGSSWDFFDNPLIQAAYETARDAAPRDWVLSRGTDLVTNGTGYMGDNTNFSNFVFDGSDAPVGASGSFHRGSSGAIDELIPFDPSRKYTLSFMARQRVAGATNRMYGYIAPYDGSGAPIQPVHYMYIAGTTTQLARDLNPGDTVIYLESAENWWGSPEKPGASTTVRSIIWWDYTDSFGKTWPVETFSKNVYAYGKWDNGAVDTSANTITLNAPYNGPAKSKGTWLSNATSGGTYIYMPSATNTTVPEEWTRYSNIFDAGIMSPEQQAISTTGAATWAKGVPPGTAQIKIGWLLNHPANPENPIEGRHAVAAVSLSDATAAQQMADEKIRTFAQSAAPTGLSESDAGDLWIDTDNHHIFRWDGSKWVEVVDPEATADSRIRAALESGGLLEDLKNQVDSQIDTYYGSTVPSSPKEGDLWLDQSDPSNARLKRYNGSSWDIFENPLVQSAYEAAQDALDEADKKVRTFAQDNEPTGMTSEDLGDLWIDTNDNNKLYRYNGSTWVEVRDKTIEEALGIANSKGRVIFSTSAPTSAEDRQPQNLWIDISVGADGPENTPHRWDGNNWVPVTDAEVIRAAQLAAEAKQRADAAHDEIGPIKNNVDALQTSVSGKNSITWDTVAPAGQGAVAGDIHYRYEMVSEGPDSGSVTRITGMWEWDGDSWISREFSEQFLPQVNIGTGTYGELDGIRLKAKSVHASDALVVGSIDDPVLIKDGTVTADKMVIDGELWGRLAQFVTVKAGQLDANEIWADSTWTGHARAQVFTAGSIPADALSIGVDELLPDPMWERTELWVPGGALGNQVPNSSKFRWNTSSTYRRAGQSRVLYTYATSTSTTLKAGDRVFLSDSRPVVPGNRFRLEYEARTSTTNHDVVMGLEIYDAEGVKIGDEFISPSTEEVDDDGNTVITAHPLNTMFTTDGIVEVPSGGFSVRPWIGAKPGDTPTSGYWYISRVSMRAIMSSTMNEWRTEVSGRGLEVFAPNGEAAIQLGNFAKVGLALYRPEEQFDDDGNPLLDDDGNPVTSMVPTANMDDTGSVGGRTLYADESFRYKGTELDELLEDVRYVDEGPKGIVAYTSANSTRGPYVSKTGVFYTRFWAEPGREYLIIVNGDVRNSTGNGVLLGLNDGSNTSGTTFLTPSISHSQIGFHRVLSHSTNYGWWNSGVITARWIAPNNPNGRVPATFLVTIETLAATSEVQWRAGDMLIMDIGKAGQFSNSSGYHLGGASGQPPQDNPPAPEPEWRTYKKTYGYSWHRTWQQNGSAPSAAQDAAYQGRTPYYTAAGIYRSMVGVKSMTSDLSGARIKKVRVRVRMDHSHNSSGGTVVIGTTSNSSRPSSFTGVDTDIVRSKFSRGQEKWITLPSSTYDGFKNGSRRGIVFYINSSNTEYYAKMAPSRVAVEVTYEKQV